MDVQVTRFREVLGLLKPVVPRKTSLPILTNILLKDGQAVATDLETMVIVRLPEVDTPCLLPYADVVKMLQFTRGGEYLHIEPKDGKVSLKWSEGSSSFVSKDVLDFPAVPEFVPVAEASLNSDVLIPALVSVLPYVSTATDRAVLNGVTLVLGEPVEVAAGDGYRMAYQVMGLSFPQNITTILPSSSVTALNLLWEKTPRTPPRSDSLIPVVLAKKLVTVGFDGQTGLRFAFGDAATAIVKLIQGSPPAWLKLIPKEEPAFQTHVMATELELAVRRAAGLAKDGKGIIRMVFKDDTALISARKDEQEVESSVKTFASQGAPNKVGLSATYLLDYLKGKDGLVTICLGAEGAPVLFQHQKNPRVLIMPMVVQW
ncbi:MAG: DNA polymerase III subunit beta [Dehalococcoidales bacterium]|nr:DNA polymerase III subunit beta [Dehalococcoidales bacterium]